MVRLGPSIPRCLDRLGGGSIIESDRLGLTRLRVSAGAAAGGTRPTGLKWNAIDDGATRSHKSAKDEGSAVAVVVETAVAVGSICPYSVDHRRQWRGDGVRRSPLPQPIGVLVAGDSHVHDSG